MRNQFLAELLEACSHFAPPKKAELLRCSIAAAQKHCSSISSITLQEIAKFAAAEFSLPQQHQQRPVNCLL
jgi:hypothetical protein